MLIYKIQNTNNKSPAKESQRTEEKHKTEEILKVTEKKAGTLRTKWRPLRWFKCSWSYQEMFLRLAKFRKICRVSWRVDVTWRWNTADVKNIVLMVRNSPKSGCLVRSWNDLIKCKTTSSWLPCCSHIQTWCTWRKWTFLYLTLCLFRLIWQFLSRHSALLTLWLGLGTNTIQSGWEKHRALLSNGCFCRHDHGWRRSDLPSAACPPPSDVKCG